MKLCASIFLGIALLAGASADAAKPNIVIILVDDMGFSDIGCYGGEIPTPNLDRLANHGVRFSQFYNTGRCSPTRASLLTGLYPHQAGMGHLDNTIVEGHPGFQGKLAANCVTIPEVLNQAGYFTALTGKWHLGQSHGTAPWLRGFQRTLNLPQGGVHFSNQTGSKGKTNLFLSGTELAKDDPRFNPPWYGADLWTEWGIRFIDEAIAADQPFFLYLAHAAPHFPCMAPEATIAKYRGTYQAGWDALREQRYLFLSDNGGNAESGINGKYEGEHPGDPHSNVYIGQCWAHLNNTPFRKYKHYNHEGGISTPLIAHWPDRIAPRPGPEGWIDTPAHLIDILATCVDAAGASYPDTYHGTAILPAQGISLLSLLTGTGELPPRALYFEHEGNAAVRVGPRKLVRQGAKGAWELFDMDRDRTEQHDLAAEHPEEVQRLARQWQDWAQRAQVLPLRSGNKPRQAKQTKASTP